MRAVISLLVGVLTYLSVGLTGVHAQDAQWTLIESEGPVFVAQPLSAPRFISLHEKIAPGSTITTGRAGRAVVNRGFQTITIGPNARIAMPAADAKGMTRIIQDLGAAMFKVDKRGVQHFEVDTPLIAAVVKGTTFTVSVTAVGHSVHVVEGLVEVSARSGGMPVPVPAGATALVSGNNPSVIELRESSAGSGGASPAPAVDPATSSERRAGGSSAATVASLGIPQAIGAGPLNFETLTNGLIGSAKAPGNAGLPNVGSGNTGGDSNAAGNAQGSSSGNGNSGSNANASGNAGGNGNGSAGGNGNGSAGGNSNGNTGANAGGNGNALGGGNGNAGASANAGGTGGLASNNNAGGSGIAGAGTSNAGGNGNGNTGANTNAGTNNAGGNAGAATNNAGGNGNAGASGLASNNNAGGKGK